MILKQVNREYFTHVICKESKQVNEMILLQVNREVLTQVNKEQWTLLN